jgi:hypothetical protein
VVKKSTKPEQKRQRRVVSNKNKKLSDKNKPLKPRAAAIEAKRRIAESHRILSGPLIQREVFEHKEPALGRDKLTERIVNGLAPVDEDDQTWMEEFQAFLHENDMEIPSDAETDAGEPLLPIVNDTSTATSSTAQQSTATKYEGKDTEAKSISIDDTCKGIVDGLINAVSKKDQKIDEKQNKIEQDKKLMPPPADRLPKMKLVHMAAIPTPQIPAPPQVDNKSTDKIQYDKKPSGNEPKDQSKDDEKDVANSKPTALPSEAFPSTRPAPEPATNKPASPQSSSQPKFAIPAPGSRLAPPGVAAHLSRPIKVVPRRESAALSGASPSPSSSPSASPRNNNVNTRNAMNPLQAYLRKAESASRPKRVSVLDNDSDDDDEFKNRVGSSD